MSDPGAIALKDELLHFLDPVVPGGQNSWDDPNGELNNQNLAPHKAYVELHFHTNQGATDWFQGGGGLGDGIEDAWRYGRAIDEYLSFP